MNRHFAYFGLARAGPGRGICDPPGRNSTLSHLLQLDGGTGRFFGDYVNWARIDGYRRAALQGPLVGLAADHSTGGYWLVGADGGHSPVRKAAGFDFPGTPATRGMYLADVVGCEIAPAQGRRLVVRVGKAGIAGVQKAHNPPLVMLRPGILVAP